MSSNKDYVLEITPPIEDGSVESLNLIKFTVRHKDEGIVMKYKWQLVALLQLLMIWVLYANWSEGVSFQTGGVAAVLAVLELGCILRQTPEDTIIAMKDIGIQSISKRAWGFNNAETFIPINNIIDLVIHEGFHSYGQCIFYLCALTKSSTVDFGGDFSLKAAGLVAGPSITTTATTPTASNNDIIKVFFPEFLPRKDILLNVWKLSRELLFADTRRYWRRVPGQGLKQILT